MTTDDRGALDGALVSQLTDLLAIQYGLTLRRLEAAPRGWTGETFVATDSSGWRCFVKAYRPDRLPPDAIAALSVLHEMHRRGFRRATRPIATTAGTLRAAWRDRVVVLFDYIDGTPTTSFDAAEVGRLVAEVHDLTTALTTPIVRETFASPYAADLQRVLADVSAAAERDEITHGLRTFVIERRDEHERDWATFDEVRARCQAAAFDLVVTHGDVQWNVMAGADGTLSLVDWDELLLAPAERDTWSFDDRPAFAAAYHATRANGAMPGGPSRELATRFYVFERYFSEVLGFATAILGDAPPARRAEALALLDGEWMEGLRARMHAPE